MFSGLIESIGRVSAIRAIPEGARLTVNTSLAPELTLGDSVAVNGVCLTVVDQTAAAVTAEISPQTSQVTTLGRIDVGSLVNLERPLRTDGRLGGHFVLGHVDGVGRITAITGQADFSLVTVSFSPDLTAWIVAKGSIAVDGTSLTVATLRDDSFDLQIVPYTWEHTALHASTPGDGVNLECDIIGKYVVNALHARG